MITNRGESVNDCVPGSNQKGLGFSESLKCRGNLDHYILENDADKNHLDYAEQNSPQWFTICDEDDIKPTKPFKFQILQEYGTIIYKTLNGYKKGDVINHCYGVMKIRTLDEIRSDQDLEGSMYWSILGMVLDGNKFYNDWVHLKESCHPNCHFAEHFVYTNTKDKITSYRCCLIASRDIEEGETLRVMHKHLRGFAVPRKECNCDKEGCLYDVNSHPICSVVSCADAGKKFGTIRKLYLHYLNEHPIPELIETLKKEEEYIKTSSYCCPVVSCMKWCGDAKKLCDHVIESHPKFEGPLRTCSNCGKQYASHLTFQRHLKKGFCKCGE